MYKYAILFCLVAFSAFAQAPTVVWDKTIGSNGNEYLPSIIRTNDGGYILAGDSYSDISGDKTGNSKGFGDYWVIKLDANGQKVWDKTIGGNGEDTPTSVVATSDSGFIIAGHSNSDASGDKTGNSRGSWDYWIVRLDSTGQKVWDKTFGGSGLDTQPKITATSDGNFIVAGVSDSDASVDKTNNSKGYNDFWVIKLSPEGEKIWDKTIGGNGPEEYPAIVSTADGSIVIAGESNSTASGDKTSGSSGGWVVKLDFNGRKVWDKSINIYNSPLYSIATTTNGDILIAGTSGLNTPVRNGDFRVQRLSPTGQYLWERTFGGSGLDELHTITTTTDGTEFILAGTSDSPISGDKTEDSKGEESDIWLVKINGTGEKVWDKTLGGSGWEGGQISIISLSNENFIIAGASDSNVSGDKTEDSRGGTDYWVVKVKPNSCPTCITGITESNFSTNEHFCAAQNLCAQGIIQKAQTDPKVNLKRSELAKVAYLGLLGRTNTTIAENYDVPFVDLQRSFNADTTYFKYAKVLTYLQYQDGKSAFDYRANAYFNPNDPITRALVLKVLLEAWNIDETTATGASPFSDVPTSHPYYQYIKKAHELGIVTGIAGAFSPDANCSREDAFLMLQRMMTSGSITKPTLAQINAGFFKPGNYTPRTLAVKPGVERGNFNHYTKTSMALDGMVPLVFAHSYNSYLTELPQELFPSYMSPGWTHSFNCYIKTFTEIDVPSKDHRYVVHYPDGRFHYYKHTPNLVNWEPEGIGVYDDLTQVSGATVEIMTPSKIKYTFRRIAGANLSILPLESITDRNGNTLTLTYEVGVNDIPRLKTVKDPGNRTFNFSYLAGTNYLTQVSLSGVGSFEGRNVTFEYSPAFWDDAKQQRNLVKYNEPDAVSGTKTTEYSYDMIDAELYLLKKIKLPKGNVIDNQYENRKLTSSRTLNSSGSPVQKMETSFTPIYAASGTTSTSTVSLTAGSVTKATNYAHNDNGLATRIQTTGSNPLDLKMDYGLSADPTSVTKIIQNEGTSSSTGVRIEYYPTVPYNVKLVKTAKAAGDSITQSYVYNAFNDISSFTNGRGFTTSFVYNTMGNLTQINHPIGSPTSMNRDSKGLINQVSTPANIVTSFTYNQYGNLTNTSTANGANPALTTSATYDALSRVVSKTDARSQTVTYDYFANDLLKKMNAPMSYYVSYGYDANDNNTTVTNAKGNATTNVYDPQTDQLMSRSFGSKTESFTYFEDGSLKTFTNGRGNVFNFTYDPSGRLTNDGYSAYDFNTDGTLNTVAHTQGTKTYTLDYDYDLLKRLNKTTCDGFAVQYRYDNNNNLDRLTYPDGKTVNYAYDAKDRVTSVTDWAGRITTYTYDDDGKVKSYTLPNNTKATYAYDAAGRPTGISHQKSTNAVLSSYTFVLDQGGNHLEENIIEPFTTPPTLTAGTTNYTTNARNETTVVGSNIYTFDANGAITNQAGQAISWDSKDNLLTRNGIIYYYDGNETRRAKTGKKYVINELINSVLAETNEEGTSYLNYYVYGPTGLLYRQKASNSEVEYYHYDFRGSTTAMTDASQNVVRQYQYDAYGKILQQIPAAASDDNPFRYVGQYGVQYEADNLYFMRARYYDPTTGKFLSEDPIWSTNLFAYGSNNPTMMIDPKGEYDFEAKQADLERKLALIDKYFATKQNLNEKQKQFLLDKKRSISLQLTLLKRVLTITSGIGEVDGLLEELEGLFDFNVVINGSEQFFGKISSVFSKISSLNNLHTAFSSSDLGETGKAFLNFVQGIVGPWWFYTDAPQKGIDAGIGINTNKANQTRALGIPDEDNPYLH